MDSTSKIIAGVIVAGLALAAVSKPAEADFEAALNVALAAKKQQLLKEGSWGNWLAVQGFDLARSGVYQKHLFSSTYLVTILGNPVATCTGAFGTVSSQA
jgi:hypothetical protein